RVLLAAAGGMATAVLVVWVFEALRFLWAEPERGPRDSVAPPTSSIPDLLVPARFVPSVIHTSQPPVRLSRLSAPLVDPREARDRAPGYIDPKTGQLLSGHVFALIVLAVLLFVYALGFLLDDPRVARGSKVPALVYLLALLTLPTWALAGAAFFLDRYRVP